MTQFLGDWAGSMIYTAMLCALLTVITPEGRVKKAVKLMCSLAVIAAVLSPFLKLDMKSYSAYLSQYRNEADRIIGEAEDDSKNLNRTYIEDGCEAYILDKAESIGIVIEYVKVRAEWDTQGFWYPVSAEIVTDAGEAEKQKLSQLIEAELGIPADEQGWSNER